MMPSSSEDEDPEVCPICEEKNDPSQPQDKKNRMIGCDGCDKWYHWSCVGIDQYNKPGKNDDWFCRRCGTKKTESGEWKPENSELNSLEVLPMRETSRSGVPGGIPPSPVRTLAQKKAYDSSPLEGVKKKRGRQPGTKIPKKVISDEPSTSLSQNAQDLKNVSKLSGPSTPPSRTSTPDSVNSSKKKNMMRESWVTGGTVVHKPAIMKLPPGISVGKSTEEEEEDQSKKVFPKSLPGLGGITVAPASQNTEKSETEGVRQNLESRYSNISMTINRDGPKTGIPKLPSSISIQKERDPSPQTKSHMKLPPGITLSRDDVSSKLPPGISIEKESSPAPRLPPGISIHKKIEEPQRRLPPGISIQKQVEERRPNLPPGIQISKTKDDAENRVKSPVPDSEDENLDDLDNPKSVSSGQRSSSPDEAVGKADDKADNNRQRKKTNAKENSGQKKKIKTPSTVESSDSEEEETGRGRRGTRDKSEQYARIRATLREDSMSDEERFGDRIPYRKKGWKPIKANTPLTSLSLTEESDVQNCSTSKEGKVTEEKRDLVEKKRREKKEKDKGEETSSEEEEDEKVKQKRLELLEKEKMKIEGKKSSGKRREKKEKDKGEEHTSIDELLDDKEDMNKKNVNNEMDELSDEIGDEINDDIMEMEKALEKPIERGRKRKSRDSDVSEASEKITKRGRRKKDEPSIDLTLVNDDSDEEPLSQKGRKSRRRSTKSDAPPEIPSSKDKKVLSSPVRNKPTAVVEPVRPTLDEDPQKIKKRGRPSKKEKKEPIPLDVQAAMRAVNGLRDRTPKKNEETGDKGSQDPKLTELQKEIIVSPSSIKTNDKELLKVDDKVRPQMSVKPTGSGLVSAGSSSGGDGSQDKWETVRDDNGHTKGLSLIVKSTDSKKKVSLVIKPFDANSSNEECDASAENNENSTSRPMDDESNPGGQNSNVKRGDLLSKVIQDTIKEKNVKDTSNMYLTEEEIAKLPIDIGAQKPNTSSAIGHPNLSGVDLDPPALPQDLADVMPSLDDVLGVNKQTKTQKDEAEIQKISNSLAADFERTKTQQQNFNAYQQHHHQQQQNQQQQQQQHQQPQQHQQQLQQQHQQHQQKYMWSQNMHQQQQQQQHQQQIGHPQQPHIGHFNWGQQQHPQQPQIQGGDHQYMKTQQPAMMQQRPNMFPNATFSTDAGGSYQPSVAGVHNLPPTIGQPPRSMPSFNVSSQSTGLPPLVPIPATSTVMSTMSQQLTSSSQPQTPPIVPGQPQLQNIRAPSTDSGMGTSNSSTPTNTPSAPTTATSEPGVWDLFEKEIADFAETCDGDESIKDKDSKAGIKILKPMELNEKAKGLQGETITVRDGKMTEGQQKPPQVSAPQSLSAPGSIGPGGARTVIVQQPLTPTKPGDTRQIVVHMTGAGGTPTKIMVQNPGSIALQPPIPGAVGQRMVVAGPPGPDGKVTYLYPLNNRLQGQPVATTVIRLAAPISGALTTVAGSIQNVTSSGANTAPVMVSGTSGLGVGYQPQCLCQ